MAPSETGTLPGHGNVTYRIDWSEQLHPDMHVFWPNGTETLITAKGGWKRQIHRGQMTVVPPRVYRKALRLLVRDFLARVRERGIQTD